MSDLFAAWFMADNYPVLLYVARRLERDDHPSDVLQRVRSAGEKEAQEHGICYTVYVGTYLAYVALLKHCRRDANGD
jgi:hypothetical protein